MSQPPTSQVVSYYSQYCAVRYNGITTTVDTLAASFADDAAAFEGNANLDDSQTGPGGSSSWATTFGPTFGGATSFTQAPILPGGANDTGGNQTNVVPTASLTGSASATLPSSSHTSSDNIATLTGSGSSSGLTLMFKGFNYVDFYNGEWGSNDTLGDVPATDGGTSVKMTGANSVALPPDFGLDVAQASVYVGGGTTDTDVNPTTGALTTASGDLTTAINEATNAGLSTFVRPIIDYLYNQTSPNGPIFFNPGDSYVPPGGFNSANLPTGEPDANGGTIPTTQNGTITGNTVSARSLLNPADLNTGGAHFVSGSTQAALDANVATFFGSPTITGSYDYTIVQEAKTATAAGATLFSVGTELDSLADNSNYTSDWTTLISDVHSAAPSLQLTYSASWITAGDVTFWNDLNYVGIDNYVPLATSIPSGTNPGDPFGIAALEKGYTAPSNTSVPSLGESVQQALTNQGLTDDSVINAFDELAHNATLTPSTVSGVTATGKLIFTEIGFPNDSSAAEDPTGGSANQNGDPSGTVEGDGSIATVADPQLQADLYTAFFDAWGAAQQAAATNGGKDPDGNPFALVGAYIWDWTPDGSDDGFSTGAADNSSALALQAIETGFTACYRRGTMILTPDGEVPVETLVAGARVTTLSGEARPIHWVGHRAYDARFIAGKRDVLPIRITAGALADGVPVRDLFVSPDHALFIDGALVMARLLVNATTIAQCDRVDALEYFHIELETHDIILAEGAPAETYIERGNRGMFHNAAEFGDLYPDDRGPVEFCAPRLEDGASELAEIRARLAQRATPEFRRVA